MSVGDEITLRAVLGFALFILAVWTTYRCERPGSPLTGWRFRLLILVGFGSMAASFVLLFFRGSLLPR